MTIRTYDQNQLRQGNLLVKVEIETMGTNRKDKRATSDMCATENASEEVAAVIKSLFNPKNPMMKEIKAIRGLLRNHHVASTAPWDDSGFRIITAKKYGEYKAACDDLIARFDAQVETIAQNRDDMVADAKKHLGGLYNPNDYPDAESLRKLFSAQIVTEVIPDREDIRLDISEEQTQRIIEEATEREQDKIQKVTKHVFDVVTQELEHMRDALARHGEKEEGAERAKSFRDTLVPRMQKLAGLLPALNIQGDPKLEKLAQEIASKLCTKSCEELREDETSREEVKDNCDEILGALDSYMGADK